MNRSGLFAIFVFLFLSSTAFADGGVWVQVTLEGVGVNRFGEPAKIVVYDYNDNLFSEAYWQDLEGKVYRKVLIHKVTIRRLRKLPKHIRQSLKEERHE